jgi:hypothetical protein
MKVNYTPKQRHPDSKDVPIHNLCSDKNYIVANAVENILASPRILDRSITSQDQSKYLRKRDYGKTPSYL